MLDRSRPVLVLGVTGMVGRAIRRRLMADGFAIEWAHTLSDLRDPGVAHDILTRRSTEPPFAAIFNCAARVGGIQANLDAPYAFIWDNIRIAGNVIDAKSPETKLIQFGSSCMYPATCRQPMREVDLLTGKPEPTNRPYAIAKLAALTMAQARMAQHADSASIITLIPPNLYGLGDNYDSLNSHVVAAMIRRFHEAKGNDHPFVINWGDGSPVREFMYVDDLADAAVHMADHYESARPLNVGTNQSVDLFTLATLIAEVVGYDGAIRWDNDDRLNGMSKKQMDSSRAYKLGWKPRVTLREGLEHAYAAYLNEQALSGSSTSSLSHGSSGPG